MGRSFECVGVARGLTLVKVFSDCRGTSKTILLGIWIDWTQAILFISFFCATKGCTHKLLFLVIF